MIECSINNISKSYGVNKIFENINFEIKTGERVGIIGKNGTGKTTIMKILMGQEPYEGEIYFKKGLKPRYLEQIPKFDKDYTVNEVLNLAFSDLYELKEKMNKVEQLLSNNSNNEDIENLIKEYGSLQEGYEQRGGYEIEEKISKVITGLNISKEMQQMKFRELSGGEKTKVMLGQLLLENPNLILLDEPTNHLDLKAIEWLEDYLKSYKGTVVIVSHDRYFLDRVVTKTIEINYSGSSIYFGNYSYYVLEKERRFLEELSRYKENERKKNKIEEQIKRYRVWGQMRDSDKMYKRAKELEKRLEKMEKFNRPIYEMTKIKLNNRGNDRTGKEVLVFDELEKSYGSKHLFSNISFTVYYQDRLVILGDNGTGKSTLVKIITNEVPPLSGTVKHGSRVEIGYLKQEIIFDNPTQSILEHFQFKYNITIGEARRELAKVLFTGDDVFKKLEVLSGGEKTRFKICMLMHENVNFLILDEPTNHLDIDTREILEETLANFQGTILFISHDRYFINKIATKVGELKDENFKIYNGNYEYYKNEIEKQKKLDINNKTDKIKESNKNVEDNVKNKEADKQKILKNKEKELKKLEDKIQILEEEIKNVNEKMIESSYDNFELTKLNNLLMLKEEELENALGEWGNLSTYLVELSQKDV